MSSPEEGNIWYVSANSQKGFTDDPERAVKDNTGAAVICSGHMKRIFDLMLKKYDRSLDVQRAAVRRVWDFLLDSMEESYTIRDQMAAAEASAETYYDLSNKMEYHEIHQDVTIEILAMLEYGYEYKQDPATTIEKIKEMARVKYEQESE